MEGIMKHSNIKNYIQILFIITLWISMIAACLTILYSSESNSSKLLSILLLAPTFSYIAIYTLNKIPLFNVLFFKILNLNKSFGMHFTSIISSNNDINLIDFTTSRIEEKFKNYNHEVKIQFDEID